jgi:hypothetical protein
MSIYIWNPQSSLERPRGTDSRDTFEQIGILSACFLQLPLASVKISVLLFYKRIFSISQKLVICIWVAIGLITVWCFIFTGVSGPLFLLDHRALLHILYMFDKASNVLVPNPFTS